MTTPTQRTRTWLILPLIVYALAAVIVTWPLARHLGDRAAGTGYADTYEVTRHIWWAGEALRQGANPFDQRLLAYPDGFMSWVQWAHPLQYLPGAVLSLVIAPLTAFNILLLITLTLNGLAAYWLGLELSDGRRPAALLGGLIFLAYPAVQGHLSVGHLGIVTLYPLPVLARCLWRVWRRGAGWRAVVLGAAAFALTALAYIAHPAYLLAPLVILLGGAQFLAERGRIWRRGVPLREQPWGRAAAMIALGGLLLLPFYGPLFTAEGRAEMRAVQETGRVTFSADALGFVSPSPFGVLAEWGIAPDYARDVLGTNSAEGTACVGVIALALAGLAVLRRPQTRPWLWLALGAAVLSLGPLLKWRDAPVTVRVESFESYVTLPWLALQHLPLFDATRTPGRFNLLTGLAISALVSAGAGVLLARLRRPTLAVALTALLGVGVLAEYQLFWPFPTGDAAQPAYFWALADAENVRAVLNVPTDDLLVAKIALYQQTLHGKPLIGGHALRRTPQNPALLAVLNRAVLGEQQGILPALADDQVTALLSSAGADRLIVHKRFVADPERVVARLRALLGAPEYEDGQLAAFVVPRSDAPARGVWLAAGNDWAGMDDDGRFVLAEASTWYVYTDAPLVELRVPVQTYGVPRTIGVSLDGDLLSGATVGEGALEAALWTTPGYHTLRFESRDGCDPYPFALSCLAADPLGGACGRADSPACVSAVFGAPEVRAASAEPQRLDVTLESGLHLDGYMVTLRDEPRALDVRLFWRAERALPGRYALFVHVADPRTAVPLAQFDGYPAIGTDDWAGGTRWVSQVSVSLPDDLPPGDYALNVGWFEPVSGKRLGVQGERPWAAEGIVYLGSIRSE
ncbi:MAG: hypothetical protein Kow00106_05780 [Anaerolineae bacterium]